MCEVSAKTLCAISFHFPFHGSHEKGYHSQQQRHGATGPEKTGESTEKLLAGTIYTFFCTQVLATIITSLWQLIESASVANLSTVIYSAERGYEGITVSLDEGTLARESYNIK